MERKGFYTNSDYWGLINGKYYRFETNEEYNRVVDELEEEESEQEWGVAV